MITSVHNPKIQAIRKLQNQAKARREQQAFVIEGVRLAEEALTSGREAQLVLFTDQLDERGKRAVAGFAEKGGPVEQVTQAVMNAISETETPQGILIVLPMISLPVSQNLDFVLILDGVRDPGNLGTILRTAAAGDVQLVLLAPGCADAFSPKVVRAGMGAHFKVPIQQLTWEGIRNILKTPVWRPRVLLADSAGGIEYSRMDLCQPIALIVGGEAGGAGPESLTLVDDRVHIPMPGGSESLNAAIAASILIFEVVRQRRR